MISFQGISNHKALCLMRTALSQMSEVVKKISTPIKIKDCHNIISHDKVSSTVSTHILSSDEEVMPTEIEGEKEEFFNSSLQRICDHHIDSRARKSTNYSPKYDDQTSKNDAISKHISESNTIHLKLNVPSATCDDDLDWFFTSSQKLDNDSYVDVIDDKDMYSNDIGIKQQKVDIESGDFDIDLCISSETGESDSEFDDCFDETNNHQVDTAVVNSMCASDIKSAEINSCTKKKVYNSFQSTSFEEDFHYEQNAFSKSYNDHNESLSECFSGSVLNTANNNDHLINSIKDRKYFQSPRESDKDSNISSLHLQKNIFGQSALSSSKWNRNHLSSFVSDIKIKTDTSLSTSDIGFNTECEKLFDRLCSSEKKRNPETKQKLSIYERLNDKSLSIKNINEILKVIGSTKKTSYLESSVTEQTKLEQLMHDKTNFAERSISKYFNGSSRHFSDNSASFKNHSSMLQNSENSLCSPEKDLNPGNIADMHVKFVVEKDCDNLIKTHVEPKLSTSMSELTTLTSRKIPMSKQSTLKDKQSTNNILPCTSRSFVTLEEDFYLLNSDPLMKLAMDGLIQQQNCTKSKR